MNEYIAVAIDELSLLGIKEAVLSPGSRSTPLSMWFCEHSEIHTYLNIDERSAAFFALGIAKKKNRPVRQGRMIITCIRKNMLFYARTKKFLDLRWITIAIWKLISVVRTHVYIMVIKKRFKVCLRESFRSSLFM